MQPTAERMPAGAIQHDDSMRTRRDPAADLGQMQVLGFGVLRLASVICDSRRRISRDRCDRGAASGEDSRDGGCLTAAVTAAPLNASPRAEGLIEAVLPGGASVRVDAHVDGGALGAVDEQ